MAKYKRILISSWWVGLFALISYLAYTIAAQRSEENILLLRLQLQNLLENKSNAIKLQKELLAEIDSYADTEWQEIILREELGLVGDGERKIFFR